jgi:NAD(P)-dependent dehydrogenase (short-subunit alcohol dehydrogenase family)
VPAASANRPCVGCSTAAFRCSWSTPIRAHDAIRSEFAGSADRLEVWRADVTDERQTIDAVSRANERFGGVYALVHIAGGAGPKRARDIEDFQLRTGPMSSTST